MRNKQPTLVGVIGCDGSRGERGANSLSIWSPLPGDVMARFGWERLRGAGVASQVGALRSIIADFNPGPAPGFADELEPKIAVPDWLEKTARLQAEVECVQLELRRLGFDPGAVDGNLGRKTLAAARRAKSLAAGLNELSADTA